MKYNPYWYSLKVYTRKPHGGKNNPRKPFFMYEILLIPKHHLKHPPQYSGHTYMVPNLPLAILLSYTNYLPKSILSCTHFIEVNSRNLILLGVWNVLYVPFEDTITSEYLQIWVRDSYPCTFHFQGNQVTYIHVNYILS